MPVDKSGGYVRHFHVGVTGAQSFQDRMIHYMAKGDESVTAYGDTKALRQELPGNAKNSIKNLDSFILPKQQDR